MMLCVNCSQEIPWRSRCPAPCAYCMPLALCCCSGLLLTCSWVWVNIRTETRFKNFFHIFSWHSTLWCSDQEIFLSLDKFGGVSFCRLNCTWYSGRSWPSRQLDLPKSQPWVNHPSSQNPKQAGLWTIQTSKKTQECGCSKRSLDADSLRTGLFEPSQPGVLRGRHLLLPAAGLQGGDARHGATNFMRLQRAGGDVWTFEQCHLATLGRQWFHGMSHGF